MSSQAGRARKFGIGSPPAGGSWMGTAALDDGAEINEGVLR
jgi:hypothetical protein